MVRSIFIEVIVISLFVGISEENMFMHSSIMCYDEQQNPIDIRNDHEYYNCVYSINNDSNNSYTKDIENPDCQAKQACFAGCVQNSCISLKIVKEIIEYKRFWACSFIFFILLFCVLVITLYYLINRRQAKFVERLEMLQRRGTVFFDHSFNDNEISDDNISVVLEEGFYVDSKRTRLESEGFD